MLQGSQAYWEINKAWEEGCPLTVDTQNAELRGHKDMWQNPQTRKKLIKPTQATVLNPL